MRTLAKVNKTAANRSIVRSFGPGYKTHWRFEQLQQYGISASQAKDSVLAVNDILSWENDPYVRQGLLYETGRASVIPEAIEFAIDCHNSQQSDTFAWTISAMVIAGFSPSEISEWIGKSVAFVIAYEMMFFDVRRHRDRRLWIVKLCHDPMSLTNLGEGASRWLTTALRGRDALLAMFATSEGEPVFKHDQIPAGQLLVDRMLLGIFAQLDDFRTARQIMGAPFTAVEAEFLMKSAYLTHNVAPTLARLDYPKALSPSERKKNKERDELLREMSPASRRKVTRLFERLMSADDVSSNTGGKDQNNSTGSA